MQQEDWRVGGHAELIEIREEEHQREGSCEKGWDAKVIGFQSVWKHFKARGGAWANEVELRGRSLERKTSQNWEAWVVISYPYGSYNSPGCCWDLV